MMKDLKAVSLNYRIAKLTSRKTTCDEPFGKKSRNGPISSLNSYLPGKNTYG